MAVYHQKRAVVCNQVVFSLDRDAAGRHVSINQIGAQLNPGIIASFASKVRLLQHNIKV